MKKILLIPFILLCMILFAVPACAMKNEPGRKFRGIPWGVRMPRKAAFGRYEWALEKVEDNGAITVFHRLEKASFAGLTISKPIEYEFHWKHGFVIARIKGAGRENYDLFVKACVKEWGSPDVNVIAPSKVGDHNFETNFWNGEKIMINLMYLFKQSEEFALSFYEKQYYLRYILK